MGQVAALATVIIVAAACSTGQYIPPTTQAGFLPTTSVPPIPAVVTPATPSGWVPVAYGNVQVSVPPKFSVLYPGWNACGTASFPGVLGLGLPTMSKVGCGAAPPRPSVTVVQIAPYRPTYQMQIPPRPHMVLNGLTVEALVDRLSGKVVGYYVPALGMAVIGSGPLAASIFRTLTRSPRTVALASGPAPSVPSGWHTVTFQGLAFDAPQSWTVNSTAVTGDDLGPLCSPGATSFLTTEVALSIDQRQLAQPGCLITGPPKPEPPIEAVEVDAGNITWFPSVPSYSEQCLHPHGLTVCPATTPAYSILALKVTVPGRRTPLLVSIGLAGNGMVARTVLYSLRAA